MKDEKIGEVVRALRKSIKGWVLPIVTYLAEQQESPYTILISTILSLRTKDEATAEASSRLFRLADTPVDMLKLPEATIAKTIYPVGFYRRKAATILDVSRVLMERFGGRVPDTIEDLLTLNGVGRKTANLVISLGYGKKGICVDTHVHRISNRLGYVKTRTPEETESALREKLPGKYWIEYNTLMVAFGQNICRPISPFCSACPVSSHCDRVGVLRSR
jgi:endonuclease III